MMQLSLPTGHTLKRQGLDQIAMRNRAFLETMRTWAKDHALRTGMVTTDDVRLQAEAVGLIPTHHNCWGAVFRGHGWVCIGRKPSALATNHYREIRVWQWVGLDTPAQKWG